MLRLAAGQALSRETGIRRKSLYEWLSAWRRLGVAGLNRKRGRQPGWNLRQDEPPGRPLSGAPPGPDVSTTPGACTQPSAINRR